MILRGRVVDARTGKGVPLACVYLGSVSCSGLTVYTDTDGYFELRLSVGQPWDIKFFKTGYFVSEITVQSQPGIRYVPDIVLRPSR